ncbi:MAG: hypothetical protein AAGK79_13350 [Pseudomonadota bacterium]
MTYSPIARIILRYGAGALFTASTGDMLASDPDVVNVTATVISAAAAMVTEWWYGRAKKQGGAT